MEIFTVHVDHTFLFTFMIESFFFFLHSSLFFCCSVMNFLCWHFHVCFKVIIKSKAPGLKHLHLSSFTVRLDRSQSPFSESLSAESTIMKRDSIALNNMPKESFSFIYSSRTIFFISFIAVRMTCGVSCLVKIIIDANGTKTQNQKKEKNRIEIQIIYCFNTCKFF